MNCPECGAGPFILSPGETPPEPTPADVEIARVQANAQERAMLIERGIDPDTRAPLGGDSAIDVAEVHAEAAVEIAEAEASAEVAAAEAVGDAMVAAAEVVGDALEVAAEVATASDDDADTLPDEIIVTDTTAEEDGESAATGSHASRWGFH